MRFLQNVSTFESLRLRDYRLLWMGQLSVSSGQWMDQIARSWLIYQLTGSSIQLGLVGAVRGIPLLLFGVLAGVVADRYGRKAQLVIAQVVNSIINVVLAVLILTNQIQPWHIYVTGFLAGTVQAFQQPARQALVNDLVGEKYLLNAISLNSAAVSLSRSLGPAVGGLLIQGFGVDVAYFVQAALYLLASVWTVQIRIPTAASSMYKSSASSGQSLLDSAREGIAYIIAHKMILALMVLGLVPIVLGQPYTSLMPIFAIDILHGNASTQGLLLMMSGIGATLGALAIASFGRRQGNGRLLIAGAAGFGLALVLFSRSPILAMAMTGTFLAGLFNSGYTAQNQTMLQMLTPAELRGRVLGVYFLDRGFMPLGSLLAGLLASLLGGPWAVTLMGGSCFLLAIGVAVVIPALWRLKLLPASEPVTP